MPLSKKIAALKKQVELLHFKGSSLLRQIVYSVQVCVCVFSFVEFS